LCLSFLVKIKAVPARTCTAKTIGDLGALLRRIERIVRELNVLAGQFGFAGR
jgi:hypothetical protein